MKKLSLITFIFAGLTLVSCKRKDIQPVISLVGANEQTVSLGQDYVESGATAMDNKDGDISDDIVISGMVNNNLKGEYRMFYDVEDSEGNKAATATRYVKVVNDADFMIGTYSAVPTCMGTMTTQPYNTTITASTKINNQIFIRRVLNGVEDQPVIATLDGDALTVPTQSIGMHTVAGSAALVSGNFLLDVVIEGDMDYSCSIAHTKL